MTNDQTQTKEKSIVESLHAQLKWATKPKSSKGINTMHLGFGPNKVKALLRELYGPDSEVLNAFPK